MHAFFLHLKYIEEVKANLKSIQNDVTYVAKLFTTAQEFEISVNDHQFALSKSLFPQLSQLKVITKTLASLLYLHIFLYRLHYYMLKQQKVKAYQL